jgi:putative SOS response-associated peptidase YedK
VTGIERFTLADRRIGHGDPASALLADGPRELRWGLLRPWRGHGGKRGPLIFGATLAEADALPLLRDGRKQRRCAVLADGVLGKASRWATPARTVAFAGIWAEHPDDGIASVALLEGDALGAVAELADRMPLVVDRDAWLAGSLVLDEAPWRIGSLANPAQGSLF